MLPSLEIFSESMQERGKMACEPQTFRRMRILFLRRSSGIFGASNACAWDQMRCSDCSNRPAYLVEDADEGHSIVALQRHRGVYTLLRSQHFGEGVWEFPRSYVDGRELGEEGVLEF